MGNLRIDIDNVIKSKSEKLYGRIPGFIIKWLKRTVHQDEINDILDKCGDLEGVAFIDRALEIMNISYDLHHSDRIEENKNYLFVSNHPLGGLDGLIAMSALGKIHPDMKVVVNDLLMHLSPIKSLFLPINKHGNMSKEYASRLHEAYSSSSPIYNFPAGLCSRLIDGEIKDPEWKKTFVTQAIKYNREIVPVYFSGRNSMFFYRLSKVRKFLGIKFNIEMLYLPDEMFRQKGGHFDIVIGTPIDPSSLKGKNAREMTEMIRRTSYELKNELK